MASRCLQTFQACRLVGRNYLSLLVEKIDRIKLFSIGSFVFERCYSFGRLIKTQRSLGTLTGAAAVSRCLFGFPFEKKAEDEMNRLFHEARIARMKQQFDDAEQLFHNALDEARERFRSKDICEREYLNACSNIYDGLADMAMSRGEFEKAEKLYKETIKTCLQLGFPKEDNAVVEISIKLASIYAMQKKDEQAKSGFEFCIKTQEKKMADEDNSSDTNVLLGLALEGYGRYLLLHNSLQEAGPLFLRAKKIAEEFLGKAHPQTLILMNDYATVQILQTNYSQAEATLKEAIELGLEKDVGEVAALFCNLGSLYLRRAEYTKAEEVCEESIRLARKNNDALSELQARLCLKKVREEREKEKLKRQEKVEGKG